MTVICPRHSLTVTRKDEKVHFPGARSPRRAEVSHCRRRHLCRTLCSIVSEEIHLGIFFTPHSTEHRPLFSQMYRVLSLTCRVSCSPSHYLTSHRPQNYEKKLEKFLVETSKYNIHDYGNVFSSSFLLFVAELFRVENFQDNFTRGFYK